MIHIIGGTYFESCHEPQRKDLLGSGFRAAIAISKLSNVRFHTYVDEASKPIFETTANAFGIKAKTSSRTKPIHFEYVHPLATPTITPGLGRIHGEAEINVKAKNILCFGMLEGNAAVEGEYVVYDPQSPIEPKFLDVKKSNVKNLALVLNGREAGLLANSPKAAISDIAKKLFRYSGASAIVIKQGVKGASVFTGGNVLSVPAYKTENVWKIGSGDIFASVFAHFWADQRKSAAIAARYASMATARYCEFKAIPLTKNFTRHNYTALMVHDKFRRSSRPAVYLAGPFFTMTQRWLVNEARRALKQQGLDVFSPMHDVGYGPADYVAPMDLDALKKCDVVFAITDGLDAGTIFEIGYANAKKIPVVVFVQNETSESLKMLEGSGCSICNDFTTAIYKSAWRGYSK